MELSGNPSGPPAKVSRRIDMAHPLTLELSRDVLMDLARSAGSRQAEGATRFPYIDFIDWLQLQPERISIDLIAARSTLVESEAGEASEPAR